MRESLEGTRWSSELASEYLLGSLLLWLCWCQIEPTIHFAVWVCTSWPACEGCLNISSNHTLVSQIPLFFFPVFLFPSLFFIIYFKFWTQVWVGSLKTSPRTLSFVKNWCFYKISLVHLLFPKVFYILIHISLDFWPNSMFLGGF